MKRAAIVPFFMVMLIAVTTAYAHDRSESYSHWYLSDTGITGTITIALREVMLLYKGGDDSIPPRELYRDHLLQQTAVATDRHACSIAAANILQAPSGFIRIELTFDCASAPPSEIRFRALFDAAPGHTHFAKLHRDNMLLNETLLTDARSTWDISDAGLRPVAYSFSAFLRLGIEHISTGPDHIAFLLSLLLVAGTLTRSFIAVTGFTLGHSVSLAAAVLGYVRADSQLVEAFIGFTVALVAAEYFLSQQRSGAGIVLASLVLAWLVGLAALLSGFITLQGAYAYLGFGIFATCYLLASGRLKALHDARQGMLLFAAASCFGLVHGFGFAGFLMETGIFGKSLFLPLLGFNLGVEAGQLMLVVAAIILARFCARFVPQAAPQLLAAGLCGTGIFWFVGRTLA